MNSIRTIMAVEGDAVAVAVCDELRIGSTVDKLRRFGDWVSTNSHRSVGGSICGQPIEIMIVPTLADGRRILDRSGVPIDECVVVHSSSHQWSPRTHQTRSGLRRFEMSAEQVHGRGHFSDIPWVVLVHSTDDAVRVANQIAGDYVHHFADRLALGMMPWGLTQGMREQPKVGDPKKVFGAFCTPQDLTIVLPGFPLKLQSMFCPNAQRDRAALVANLAPAKIESFISIMVKILRLIRGQVETVEFFALAPDLLDHPDIIGVLHPRTLASGDVEGQLHQNWSAFTEVVRRLSEAAQMPIQLTSVCDRVARHLDRAKADADTLALAGVLASDFGSSVPSYAGLSSAETRRRVEANILLYLASAYEATEAGAVVLGVEVSGKYWDRLWDGLKARMAAPPLFWLPARARQHFAFQE